MATANPIEDLLSTDIDESEVSALVGSLESRLASPTHKDTSHQIADSSANSNHISNVLNVSSGSCNSHFNNQGQKGLQTQNLYGSNVKSTSGGQILGIPSLLNSANVTNTSGGIININSLNTTANINSPNSVRGVNSNSGNIMLVSSHSSPHSVVSHTTPHVTVGPNGNITYVTTNNRASPQSTATTHVTAHNIVNTTSGGVQGKGPSAMYNLASIAAEQKPLPTSALVDMKGLGVNTKLILNDQDKKIAYTTMSGSPHSSKPHYMVKHEMRNIKQEPSQSNVHIVNAPLKGGVGSNPGSPNVITTRTISSPGSGVMRPQILTSQPGQSNGASQAMTVVNMNSVSSSLPRMPNATNSQPKTLQSTRVNAPIRIAAAPQQINIAPRPGANTITLPPGFQLPPGTIMMKNEQGQIMLVSTGGQQGGLPTTSSTLPGGKVIQTIKSQTRPGAPQTVVTIQQPPGGGVLHPGTQGHSMTSVNTGLPGQSVGQSPGPVPTGVTTTQGPSLHPGSTPAAQQQAMEHVKKCKNFLSTLIKLASSQPPQTIHNVRELIQRLIDGKVEPEQFTEKLQVELNSSPQPNLVPFLKKSLPLLRQSLIQNKMTIEGVKAPPPEVLPAPHHPHSSSPVSMATRPHLSQHPHTIQSSQGQVKHIVRQITPQQLAQMKSQKHIPLSAASPLAGHTAMGKVSTSRGGISGAMPTTVNALQARMGTKHQDAGGGQHKEKRKFESLKDADDDINDVATMGGVNLSEESKNILATNADFIGTHIRSCKDELFLNQGPLLGRINSIAKKYGITDIPSDVVNLVSQATQERLRNIAERLSTLAEHRTEIYRMDSRFEVTQDTKTQIKFLEEIDKLEKRRHEEQEREILLRAAKSRSKTEDPEQAKLKQKAKELQLAEAEELRQEQANKTALAAIGPRKKKKVDISESASSSSLANGMTSTPSRSGISNRPRIKRVNLRDLIFLMEQERDTRKSTTLYKAFLK